MPFSIVAAPAVERVLAKLEGVKPTGQAQWMALCPAHDDQQSSLSLKLGSDGRMLMKCHAGCTTAAIVAAMGLTMGDLFATPREPATNGKPAAAQPAQGVTERPRLSKTYDYYKPDGTLAFQSCRFEPKTFRQRRRAGNGEWVYNLQGVEPILYRLPELIEAVAQEKRVFVVEGEKDADTLVELGYIATTNPMGAGKWKDAYSEILKGADVVILPDNDNAGGAHAEQVAVSLFAQGCTVKVVQLPQVPVKGDVTDWFNLGGDLDQLESLIGRTLRWTPEKLEADRKVLWRLDELWENDSIMRPPPPIVPRIAWAGRSTLLAAREKSGKSTLTGYIAACVSTGRSFLNEPCPTGDVLIVGLEEYVGDTARRLRHFGADATRCHLVIAFAGDPRERTQELAQFIDKVDPILVIVDSFIAFGRGVIQSENDATQTQAVIQPLTDLAHHRGVSLIIIHHAEKTHGRARGSTAIMGGTDVVCEFSAPSEDTDPTLRRMKTVGRVPYVPVYDLRFDGNDYSLTQGEEAPVEARILATIRNRPGISMNDLAQAVTARKEIVSRAVVDMLAKGILTNLSESFHRAKLTVSVAANLSLLNADH